MPTPQTWPTGVRATPRREGFLIEPATRTIRSQVDAGRPKQRPSPSGAGDIYTVSWTFSPTEYAAFIAWVETTLADGALSFTWPVAGFSNPEARFIGGAAPYTAARTPGGQWRVSARLEVF